MTEQERRKSEEKNRFSVFCDCSRYAVSMATGFSKSCGIIIIIVLWADIIGYLYYLDNLENVS
jgi:hypothetical protein